MDSPASSLILRQIVMEQARTWLGTPFQHQAAVRGAGVGCGSLLVAVYAAATVPVPPAEALLGFPHDWHLHTAEERYLGILSQYARPVEIPEPGDIALFRIGKVYAHSAIVIEWPLVIHVMWQRTVEYADAKKAPLARRKTLFLSPFPQ